MYATILKPPRLCTFIKNCIHFRYSPQSFYTSAVYIISDCFNFVNYKILKYFSEKQQFYIFGHKNMHFKNTCIYLNSETLFSVLLLLRIYG
jgi:hypothetical protein